MAQVKIICWASGLLEISHTCPEGALPLVEAEEQVAIEALDALATHSYEGDQRLVPKSEAWISALLDGDEDAAAREAYNSVMAFRARLVRTLGK